MFDPKDLKVRVVNKTFLFKNRVYRLEVFEDDEKKSYAAFLWHGNQHGMIPVQMGDLPPQIKALGVDNPSKIENYALQLFYEQGKFDEIARE